MARSIFGLFILCLLINSCSKKVNKLPPNPLPVPSTGLQPVAPMPIASTEETSEFSEDKPAGNLEFKYIDLSNFKKTLKPVFQGEEIKFKIHYLILKNPQGKKFPLLKFLGVAKGFYAIQTIRNDCSQKIFYKGDECETEFAIKVNKAGVYKFRVTHFDEGNVKLPTPLLVEFTVNHAQNNEYKITVNPNKLKLNEYSNTPTNHAKEFLVKIDLVKKFQRTPKYKLVLSKNDELDYTVNDLNSCLGSFKIEQPCFFSVWQKRPLTVATSRILQFQLVDIKSGSIKTESNVILESDGMKDITSDEIKVKNGDLKFNSLKINEIGKEEKSIELLLDMDNFLSDEITKIDVFPAILKNDGGNCLNVQWKKGSICEIKLGISGKEVSVPVIYKEATINLQTKLGQNVNIKLPAHIEIIEDEEKKSPHVYKLSWKEKFGQNLVLDHQHDKLEDNKKTLTLVIKQIEKKDFDPMLQLVLSKEGADYFTINDVGQCLNQFKEGECLFQVWPNHNAQESGKKQTISFELRSKDGQQTLDRLTVQLNTKMIPLLGVQDFKTLVESLKFNSVFIGQKSDETRTATLSMINSNSAREKILDIEVVPDFVKIKKTDCGGEILKKDQTCLIDLFIDTTLTGDLEPAQLNHINIILNLSKSGRISIPQKVDINLLNRDEDQFDIAFNDGKSIVDFGRINLLKDKPQTKILKYKVLKTFLGNVESNLKLMGSWSNSEEDIFTIKDISKCFDKKLKDLAGTRECSLEISFKGNLLSSQVLGAEFQLYQFDDPDGKKIKIGKPINITMEVTKAIASDLFEITPSRGLIFDDVFIGQEQIKYITLKFKNSVFIEGQKIEEILIEDPFFRVQDRDCINKNLVEGFECRVAISILPNEVSNHSVSFLELKLNNTTYKAKYVVKADVRQVQGHKYSLDLFSNSKSIETVEFARIPLVDRLDEKIEEKEFELKVSVEKKNMELGEQLELKNYKQKDLPYEIIDKESCLGRKAAELVDHLCTFKVKLAKIDFLEGSYIERFSFMLVRPNGINSVIKDFVVSLVIDSPVVSQAKALLINLPSITLDHHFINKRIYRRLSITNDNPKKSIESIHFKGQSDNLRHDLQIKILNNNCQSGNTKCEILLQLIPKKEEILGQLIFTDQDGEDLPIENPVEVKISSKEKTALKPKSMDTYNQYFELSTCHDYDEYYQTIFLDDQKSHFENECNIVNDVLAKRGNKGQCDQSNDIEKEQCRGRIKALDFNSCNGGDLNIVGKQSCDSMTAALVRACDKDDYECLVLYEILHKRVNCTSVDEDYTAFCSGFRVAYDQGISLSWLTDFYRFLTKDRQENLLKLQAHHVPVKMIGGGKSREILDHLAKNIRKDLTQTVFGEAAHLSIFLSYYPVITRSVLLHKDNSVSGFREKYRPIYGHNGNHSSWNNESNFYKLIHSNVSLASKIEMSELDNQLEDEQRVGFELECPSVRYVMHDDEKKHYTGELSHLMTDINEVDHKITSGEVDTVKKFWMYKTDQLLYEFSGNNSNCTKEFNAEKRGALKYPKFKNRKEWRYCDTYGDTIFTSTNIEKSTMIPYLRMEFESRYHLDVNNKDKSENRSRFPHVEIITSPIGRESFKKEPLNFESAWPIMYEISNIVRHSDNGYQQATVEEIVEKMNQKYKTNNFDLRPVKFLQTLSGYAFQEGLFSWSDEVFKDYNGGYQKFNQTDDNQKISRQLSQVPFESFKDICFVQSNVGVYLGQFFTSPLLIQSIGKDNGYLASESYFQAWKWSKKIMSDLQVMNGELGWIDEHNNVAGILTYTIYYIFIRSILYESNIDFWKGTISQLLKIELRQLARSKYLTKNEKDLLLQAMKLLASHHNFPKFLTPLIPLNRRELAKSGKKNYIKESSYYWIVDKEISSGNRQISTKSYSDFRSFYEKHNNLALAKSEFEKQLIKDGYRILEFYDLYDPTSKALDSEIVYAYFREMIEELFLINRPLAYKSKEGYVFCGPGLAYNDKTKPISATYYLNDGRIQNYSSKGIKEITEYGSVLIESGSFSNYNQYWQYIYGKCKSFAQEVYPELAGHGYCGSENYPRLCSLSWGNIGTDDSTIFGDNYSSSHTDSQIDLSKVISVFQGGKSKDKIGVVLETRSGTAAFNQGVFARCAPYEKEGRSSPPDNYFCP